MGSRTLRILFGTEKKNTVKLLPRQKPLTGATLDIFYTAWYISFVKLAWKPNASKNSKKSILRSLSTDLYQFTPIFGTACQLLIKAFILITKSAAEHE